MLKKPGNIAIVLLLLLATAGIPVTQHYCGATEISFSIYTTPKACCKGHCDKCHNVFKFSKVNDNFVVGSSVSVKSPSDFVTLQTVFFKDLFNYHTISPLTGFVNQRADFNYRVYCSPASLGTFRC